MRRTTALPGLVLAILLGGSGGSICAWAQTPDAVLGERIAESVRSYARFSIFDDVDIRVDNQDVVLTGRVTIPLKRREIEQHVARIDGIRSLTNDIGVLPASPTDDKLRRQVANAIYNHPSFWRYAERTHPPIHIIIEHQHVTLTGAVESQADRILAHSLAQVPGVVGVENRLRVARR